MDLIKLFFNPETDYGFDHLGVVHIAWLVFCLIMIVILVRTYRHLPQGFIAGSPRRRMLLVIALIPVALLVGSKIDYIVWNGDFPVERWPLFTCNLCEMLMLIYAIKPNDFCANVVFGLGLPGGVAALIVAPWNDCPPLSYEPICGFMEHSLTVAFVLMLIFGHDFRPSIKKFWQPLAAIAGYFAIIYPVNKIFDSNFAYTNRPAKGSILVTFQSYFGNPGYLIPYAILVVVGVSGMFVLYELIARAVSRSHASDVDKT